MEDSDSMLINDEKLRGSTTPPPGLKEDTHGTLAPANESTNDRAGQQLNASRFQVTLINLLRAGLDEGEATTNDAILVTSVDAFAVTAVTDDAGQPATSEPQPVTKPTSNATASSESTESIVPPDVVTASLLVTLTETDYLTTIIESSQSENAPTSITTNSTLSSVASDTQTSASGKISDTVLVTLTDEMTITDVVATDTDVMTATDQDSSTKESPERVSDSILVTFADHVTATDIIGSRDASASDSTAVTPSPIGTETAESTSEESLERVSDSILVTFADHVTATDIIGSRDASASDSTAVTPSPIGTETAESTSEGSQDKVSTAILVTTADKETVTDVIGSGNVSGAIRVTDAATITAVDLLNLTEVISQGPAPTVTEMTGSVDMASTAILVTTADSETVTNVIGSRNVSEANRVTDAATITGVDLLNFTEVISEGQAPNRTEITGSLDRVSAFILVTIADNETVTEVIGSHNKSGDGSAATYVAAITGVDLLNLTEVISEGPAPTGTKMTSSLDRVSTAILVTTADSETVTDVIGSGNVTGANNRVTDAAAITGVDLLNLTEAISEGPAPNTTAITGSLDRVSAAILVTTADSETVTDVIVSGNVSGANRVTDAATITGVDLLNFTKVIPAGPAPNGTKTPENTTESSLETVSAAILVTTAENETFTAVIDSGKATEGVSTVTDMFLVTAADFVNFTEVIPADREPNRTDMTSVTSESSMEMVSAVILVTIAENKTFTAIIDSKNATEKVSADTYIALVTAADLVNFTEVISAKSESNATQVATSTTQDVTDVLTSASTLVTNVSSSPATNSTGTSNATEAVPMISVSQVIEAFDLINFTDTVGTSKKVITPQPIVPSSDSSTDETDAESTGTFSKEESTTSAKNVTGADTTEVSPSLNVTGSQETTVTAAATTTEATSKATSAVSEVITSTIPSATMTPSRRTTISLSGEMYCNTSFCEQEGRFLSDVLKDRASDPCDNFYAYVCADWSRALPDLSAVYMDTADAMTGAIEDAARKILDASATNEQLRDVLTSLGVDLQGLEKASSEQALRAAGSVQYKLGVAPLICVSLDAYDLMGYTHILALDDGDVLMSREDAMSGSRLASISDLACVYLQAVAPAEMQAKDLCDNIAQVAVQLANVSLQDRPTQERMTDYSLKTWEQVAVLEPLLRAINGSEDYVNTSQPLLLKNRGLLDVLKTLLSSKAEHVYQYVGFHVAVFLSPFLDAKEALWELALFAAAAQKTRRRLQPPTLGRVFDEEAAVGAVVSPPPPKWRVCLRLIDRLLPSLLIVAYAKAINHTALFQELMADVISEEIRSTFIDHVVKIGYFDSWTRHIFKGKAKTVNLYSMFPLRQSFHDGVIRYANKVQSHLLGTTRPLDVFLKLGAFVGARWKEPKEYVVPETRMASSLFDSDCLHKPQHDAVLIPMGMFNHSVPTSARERMFHIPGIGHRLAGCLFRAVFPENFYNPYSIYWTNVATNALKTKADCFAQQYHPIYYPSPYAFTRIGENAALRIAFEDFQQRLYSKRYLGKDYRLVALNMTADQLFFTYYALSYCRDSSQDSADAKMFAQDRVNVPLMNMEEFATAFNCASGKPMNPPRRCDFWY
ncbi:uncharacterized protein LOC144124059 [Amblyomma americanum]